MLRLGRVLFCALVGVPGAAAQPASDAEALFAAARAGDVVAVRKALDEGVDANAKARYDVTALTFAATAGHLEVVRLLLERGADPNILDTFYKARAIDMALADDRFEIARLLLERGSKGASGALMAGIRGGHVALVKAALAADDLDPPSLARAATLASDKRTEEIAALVQSAADANPVAAKPAHKIDPALLAKYAGSYRNDSIGLVTVAVKGDQLIATASGGPLTLTATSDTSFVAEELPNATVSFTGRAGTIEQMVLAQPERSITLARVAVDTAPGGEASKPPAVTDADKAVAPRGAARDWPGFRGANASGNGDGQGAIVEWDAAAGKNVRWKTPIPGVAVSSPVVAGSRVFVTTAIPTSGDRTFRTGLYGDVKPVDDLSEHEWKLYALEKASGKILWDRIVHKGKPVTKRHTKSSQASSTPATDGRRIVAMFGTIGLLACYDVEGKELWRKDLGIVDSGWFFDPTFQWGHSSSPVVYKNTVIVQADQQKNSFIAAFDLVTGNEVWRTPRADEISTWGTPTIVRAASGRDELVTNGTKVRAYDPATGRLLWTLGANSEITVATPVASDALVYVTGGYPPVRPVYAIKVGTANGDISLDKGQTSNAAVAWSNDREGTYIPTPIVYDGILYTMNNNGILTAYDAKTGERVYRARVGGGGSFSASPVAADGRLYVANEDGDVYVVKAGREYVELTKNPMGEVIMATPAISDGLIIVRTLGHVYGIGAGGR
jgi:outer membrane protein assembly factor BamB